MHLGTDSNCLGPTFGCSAQPQPSAAVVWRVLGAIDGLSGTVFFVCVWGVVGLVMLWSEPLALFVCCSENECNEVKVLIVCTCAAQATERFTFGFLLAISGEQSPFYLLDFLGAKAGRCF